MDELLRVVGPVLMVIGLLVTADGVLTWWREWSRRDWHPADGVLRAAKVKTHSADLPGLDEYGTRRSSPTYSAKVLYEYTVGGVTYRGDRIGSGFGISGSKEMDVRVTLLERHWQAGEHVPVYYNPRKPEEAVLIRGNVREALVWVFAGSVVMFAGAVVYLLR